ncbi:MAG: TonB-dependent receptor [Candidatus Binatia bacterium]|nr:TonB-dependent receptor [Candidatus Binatia bacterium]
MPVLRLLLATLILLPAAPLWSGAESSPPTTDEHVDTIVVTGTRSKKSLHRIPAAMSVVEGDDIRKARPTVGLEEPLRRIPGVFVQNSGNYAQDFRVQIRGFGTRAAFGIREVKVLVDGLPETLPDGQSQVDTIELATIQRVEVLRGAGASLYGNAAGGVLHVITDDPPEEPGVNLSATGGSYGMAKIVGQFGAQRGNLGGIGTASYLQTDGYRDHSGARSAAFIGRLVWDLDEKTELKVLLDGAHAPKADDPGGLTGEQANQDPRQARDRNVLLDAGESVDQIRLGAVLDRDLESGSLDAYAYTLYRDFFTKLPIVPAQGDGIVQFDRISPGGGLRYSYDRPVLGWDQTLTVGTDIQYQRDDRQRFANEEGQKGTLGLDQIEEVTGAGIYLREAVSLTADVEVSGGVRYDTVHYSVDVKTPPDSDASGSRTLDAWSPSGGVVFTPTEALSLFGNVSTAFQVPTTTELVNPDGPGFNPNIQPQTARSYELGLRFGPPHLDMGVALYRIDIDDELIPFETPAGRVAFRNAGRSRRYGVEVDWRSELLQGLVWTGSGTAMRAKYINYTTDDGDFAGNREPGIPPWFVYQELAYGHDSGLHAALEAYLVGGYFVDDANTATTPGYGLLNVRFGWDTTVGDWDVQPFVGLQNLTNARYDGTVRLNAFGGRYYEPAPSFNVYGGVRIAQSFG